MMKTRLRSHSITQEYSSTLNVIINPKKATNFLVKNLPTALTKNVLTETDQKALELSEMEIERLKQIVPHSRSQNKKVCVPGSLKERIVNFDNFPNKINTVLTSLFYECVFYSLITKTKRRGS